MIPRYSRPEMTRIWSPENRYRIWFEIEAYACDAQAALGIIPESAARAVWERGAFEVEIPLQQIFENPTIASLAGIVASRRSEANHQGPHNGLPWLPNE